MRRDSQKGRVYAAESVIRGGLLTKIEAWAFVERVERDAWFIRRFGRRRFTVTHKHHGAATGGWGHLALPRWAWQPAVILHEIAHCVAPTNCWHDWQFARVYLELVRHFMGAENYLRLRTSFREHRVRYKRPRRLSPEARAAATERLRQYRAASVQ